MSPVFDMRVWSGRCTPVAEWPVADQTAWATALVAGDPFEPGGLAAGWAPATRWVVANGYGLWLTWLAEHGWLEPQQPPVARITKERVAAYVAALQPGRSPFSVQSRVQQLGNALRAMAPADDWRWILRAAGRLRSRAVSVRNKRARLQSPARLAELGEQLMAQAEGNTTAAAMAYRDGLIIALLAYRPIRARNLTSITCGEHLVSRDGVWRLIFPAAETKAKQPIEFDFPADLVPYLERYLAHWRPILLTRGGRQAAAITSALWVSTNGTHMVYASIGHQVRRRTRESFGVALSPHFFRDCAATAIAIVDPKNVRITTAILGHATLATSERHYNQATGLVAGRRHQDTIAALRARGSAKGDRDHRKQETCLMRVVICVRTKKTSGPCISAVMTMTMRPSAGPDLGV
jgi:integrase/recombinase XerD